MKRYIALLLAVCMTLTMGVSLAQEDRNFDETLEIKWVGMNDPNEYPVDDSRIAKIYEEEYNIDIKNVQVDIRNTEQLNLQLTTGLEFDIFTYSGQSVDDMLNCDVIRSIAMEYLETYAPDIVKMLDEADERWRSLVTMDGEIWAIPCYSESYKCPMAMAVRTDWMENLNITELPTTLDELEAMLLRFVTDDPDGNGVDDTYALAKWDNGNGFQYLCAYVFGAYGVIPNAWNVAEDGTPVYYATMEQYREALKRMRKWYELGIFDPECISDTRETAASKFAAGKYAGCTGTEWTLISMYDGTCFYELCEANPELDRDAIVTYIPPVGKTYAYANSLTPNPATYFGRDCTDEKMIRLLQLLNDAFRDEKYMARALYGEEGIDYTVDEEGFYTCKLEAVSMEGNGRYYHFSIPSNQMKLHFPNQRYDAFMAIIDYDMLPRHLVSLYTTDEDREYGAALSTIETEYFWKVLLGQANTEEDWDAYVQNWNDAGGRIVTEAKLALAEEKGLN